MRVHYLFSILAAAAGTLAKSKTPPVPCADQKNAIKYDASLQYLTTSMTSFSAGISSLIREFGNWNGDHKKQMQLITEMQSNIICWASVSVLAYTDAEFTLKTLSIAQQNVLPMNQLVQNMIAYATLMQSQDSQNRWAKWKTSKNSKGSSATGRRWLDSSKSSFDEFLFTYIGRIPKDQWNGFLTNSVVEYDNAFATGRNLYQP